MFSIYDCMNQSRYSAAPPVTAAPTIVPVTRPRSSTSGPAGNQADAQGGGIGTSSMVGVTIAVIIVIAGVVLVVGFVLLR